jgi:hypothetical protein
MSPTPAADFADWTGGTDPFGNGWGTRARLINAETGTLISTVDTWNYGAAGTIDLTQTWELNSGTYAFGASVSSGGDISLYDRDQMEFISMWHAIGSSFDPSVYSDEFFGTGIASTVAGVRSWIQWTASSAGTLLNNGTVDYGYAIPAGGDIFGSRAPDGTEFQIIADIFAVTAQTIPEFIEL